MTNPEGYKLYSGILTAAIQAKAMSLLGQDYGYSETVVIDGKNLLFIVEEHTWYGANPDEPEEPHKGVTVYEPLQVQTQDLQSFNALSSPLAGVAALGLVATGIGYLALKKKRRR